MCCDSCGDKVRDNCQRGDKEIRENFCNKFERKNERENCEYIMKQGEKCNFSSSIGDWIIVGRDASLGDMFNLTQMVVGFIGEIWGGKREDESDS